MAFSIEAWRQRFCISDSTLGILIDEELTNPQLLASLTLLDVEKLCLTFGQRKALQNGIVSLRQTTPLHKGVTRHGVFCVYTESTESFVMKSILPVLHGVRYKVTLLRRDIKRVRDTDTFISDHVNNRRTFIVVFFSNDIKQCRLCQNSIKYIRQHVIDQQRFIPVVMRGGEIPSHLSTISKLDVDSPNFYRLLTRLDQNSTDLRQQEFNEPPMEAYSVQTEVQPMMILKERPKGPLKVFGKAGGKRRFQTTTSTDPCDNRLVFLVMEKDLSQVSDVSVDLEVQQCVQHLRHGGNSNLECASINSYVRTSKVEPSIVDLVQSNEHVFIVRVRHPQHVRSMTIIIAARLLQNCSAPDMQRVVLHEDIMTFHTAESREPTKKKKSRKPRLQEKMYAGDTEEIQVDDKRMKRLSYPRNSSFVRNRNHAKLESAHNSLELMPRVLTERVRGLGILLKKGVRIMMLDLEQLGDDNVSDGFEPFYQKCDHLMNSFESQNRWSEYMLVLVKMAGVDHYRKKYKESKLHLKQVLHTLRTHDVPDKELLEGRMLYYLSAVYREKKMFGKAEEYIEDSIKVLADRAYGEDTAKAFYNKGKLYLKMLETGYNSENKNLRTLTNASFMQAVDHFAHSTTGQDNKQIRRCLLNMSKVSIDCPFSKIGQSHAQTLTLNTLKSTKFKLVHTTELDLKHAEGYLNDITGRYWSDEVSNRNNMQINVSQAEVLFCRALYFLHNTQDQDNISKFSEAIGEVIVKLEGANIIGSKSGFKESSTIAKLISQFKCLKPCSVGPSPNDIEIPSDPDYKSMTTDGASDGPDNGQYHSDGVESTNKPCPNTACTRTDENNKASSTLAKTKNVTCDQYYSSDDGYDIQHQQMTLVSGNTRPVRPPRIIPSSDSDPFSSDNNSSEIDPLADSKI